MKTELAQTLNIHVTIPYKAKRPTIYCATASTEGKKKVYQQKPTREQEASLKRIKEVRASRELNKKKSITKDKIEELGETQRAPEAGRNGLLKSQKIGEEKKRGEAKLTKNNTYLPPIEKPLSSSGNANNPAAARKLKQNVKHIKIRSTQKQTEGKKGAKSVKGAKKGEVKKETKKGKAKN